MDTATHFILGAVTGFWLSTFLFGTLIYKASKSLPKLAEVKNRTQTQDLYPPKDNN